MEYTHKRFLIVDDFESFRRSLNEMILGLGAEYVDLARNGKESLAMCQDTPYDIILMDFNLGHGKSGQQILEELHAFKLIKHSTIFIMITAEVSRGMVLSALEYQPDAYLAKPFSLGELKARLDVSLSKNERLSDILSALDDQNHKKVIALCDQQIEAKARDLLWCLKMKADLLYEIGDYEEAKEVYAHSADDRQPNWALLGLGKTLTALKEYTEATSYLLQLINKNPFSLEAHDALADNYKKSGDVDSAQDILNKALLISPRSVLRQQTYADICTQNEDLVSASTALRKTIILSENSMHHCADNGLKLARCLSNQASEIDDAAPLLDEALKTLTKLNSEFDTPEVKVRSKLVEACVHHTSKDKDKAKTALEEASTLKKTYGLEDTPEILLEFAETYTNTDNNEKAQAVLAIITEKYSDDPNIASAIDVLLDNPVSKEGKADIKSINQRGIKHYESKHYDAAIHEFSMAITRYPKHIGLQLNLVQAILAILQESNDIKHLKKCRVIMKKLNRIQENNEHYNRYTKMKAIYDKLSAKLNEENNTTQQTMID